MYNIIFNLFNTIVHRSFKDDMPNEARIDYSIFPVAADKFFPLRKPNRKGYVLMIYYLFLSFIKQMGGWITWL